MSKIKKRKGSGLRSATRDGNGDPISDRGFLHRGWDRGRNFPAGDINGENSSPDG
jgi:hypothetical protein